MMGTEVIAGCVLAFSVLAGLIVHEWSHALALRSARIEYDIEYFPERTDGVFAAIVSCPWAVVRPRPTGREPAWQLRAASLTPLLLTLPLVVLAVAGQLPSRADPVGMAALLGWLACALPSPQDFSVAFYAHRVLDTDYST